MSAHDVAIEALKILGLQDQDYADEDEASSTPASDSFAFRFEMARGGTLRIVHDSINAGFHLEGIMRPPVEKSGATIKELLLKANFLLMSKGFVFTINPLTSEIYLCTLVPFSAQHTQVSVSEKAQELAKAFMSLGKLTLAWIEFMQTMHLHAPDVAQDPQVLRQLTEIDETFLRV